MPLQKSFSDQNGSTKPRQPWIRAKSHSAGNTTKPGPQRPLAPVSEAARNKMHAYDFRPAPETAGKENAVSTKKGKLPAGKTPNNKQHDDQDAAPAPAKLNPAVTPSGRLAWQDLIGTSDAVEEETDTSPNERILWDTKQNGPPISPIVHQRRGKKRARSSSPVSSPANNPRSSPPTVNVKQLSEALKSPHADPALELWDRFSCSGSTATASFGAPNPALAQVMISSSPQPAKFMAAPGAANTASEGGLRRAISCGAHWPKRRRGDRGEPLARMDAVAENSPSRGSKSSMVNTLLQSMTGEINRSKAVRIQNEAMRSPSPRNKVQCVAALADGSPSKPPPRFRTAPPEPNRETHASTKPEPLKDDFSDYGDDDFDDFDADTLMVLEATTAPARTMKNTTPLPTPNTGPGKDTTATLAGDVKSSSDDDFGDLDDDVFAAAEGLMAQAESSLATPVNPVHVPRPSMGGEPTPPVGEAQDGGDDAYGDDFGLDFDFDAAEIAATQSVKQASAGGSLSPAVQKPKAIQRYLVTNVLESEYRDDMGRAAPEKVLLVQVDRSNVTRTINLRGDWFDTEVSPKSFVHVLGEFLPSGQCIIDNHQNILILHPDQLISATVVADSFTCMRRAVLQDRVKATSEASAPLVYGTLLHEIFQEAMMANQWTSSFLDNLIATITERHVEDLYKIKVSLSDACEHLRSKMPELRSWAAAFVSSYPKADAIVQGRNGDKATMCVSKLLDVEEHVWSPMYGLKGNIDATVQVTMRDGNEERTLTVPFEVKTGHRATSNHQAQTSLYNLLLADRYDIEIAFGILYYMENSQTIRIPTIRNELRHMIMQRNQLACYVRERSVQLPPMKRSTNACGNCYAKVPCFVYHKLADDGDGETSGMAGKFDEVVKHLSPVHQEFFLKWEDLLTKEEKETQKLRRELWTMLSSEREKVGRCFSNVMIEEGSAAEEKGSPKINRFKYTFIKDTPAAGFSFLDSQLVAGEPIVISDEGGHFALALGYVTSVRKQRISVAVDRRLHNARVRQPGFDEVDNQTFASMMEVVPEGAAPSQSQGLIRMPPIRYRLDKDEFSNGMATVRNNLVQVMSDGVFGSRQIRRLVVDLVKPTFKSVSTQYTISGNDSLNVDQERAIEKVMSANDYALVLGMPGTGKTTTIAHIIRALVRQGKSVLLTSYTHSAVDNILLKLKTDGMPILRLGAPAKVHPEVQEFATLASQPRKTFEDIHSAWHDAPIVATTCLGVSHAVFQERTFDYCIVDEASQITLPICLGPIRLAKTFVLVGDHNQLPPLVQNEDARAGGLDISLFKLLSDTHPDSVVNLEHQYRMCEDIMTLSNTLIYQGRLKCGTEELRHRSLHVPDMAALQQRHYTADTITRVESMPRSFCRGWTEASCWLRAVLDPAARVRFINTDAVPASQEEAKGNRTVNPTEVRVVTQLVDGLLTAGVPASEVGVMTHYRSQLALLKHQLRGPRTAAVELHTADRFQGRDKEVVVLSLVRSNDSQSIGDLLKDWRRINVAFTRARTKLLVVGSRATLRGAGDTEMVARFVRLMEERDWVYDLPPDALGAHCFDDTAASAPPATGLSSQRSAGSPRKTGGRGGGAGGDAPAPKKKTPGKRGRVTDRALLRGKPVLQDVFHELMS